MTYLHFTLQNPRRVQVCKVKVANVIPLPCSSLVPIIGYTVVLALVLVTRDSVNRCSYRYSDFEVTFHVVLYVAKGILV